jgi:sigma54-dependent transcription regulator
LQSEFVEVNCATLRGDAAMSTLFGHVARINLWTFRRPDQRGGRSCGNPKIARVLAADTGSGLEDTLSAAQIEALDLFDRLVTRGLIGAREGSA